MSINKIVRRTTQQAPSGYILGRKSPGNGPVELLNLADLQAFGIASKQQAAAGSAVDGFGFSICGRTGAAQIICTGVFAKDITFVSLDPGDIVTAGVAATSSAAFSVQAVISGIFTEVGQITFSAAGTIAAVTWNTGQFTLPAGTQLRLVAPASQDATLSNIAGKVVGSET